jgi:hypothetical protein
MGIAAVAAALAGFALDVESSIGAMSSDLATLVGTLLSIFVLGAIALASVLNVTVVFGNTPLGVAGCWTAATALLLGGWAFHGIP